jgi:enterochelin esterase-like enzyme
MSRACPAPAQAKLVQLLAAGAALAALVAGSCATAGAAPLPVVARAVPRAGARKGPDAFVHVHAPAVVDTAMWSRSLKRSVQVSVYLPPGYSPTGGPYPVLYLLHGVPGNAPSMFHALRLESTLDRLISSHEIKPFVVVGPSDGPLPRTDTEWANSPVRHRWRWASYVTGDLVAWAEHTLPVCATRSGRAIGGLSMGAFGAVNLALHHLAEYGSATLWSPYFLGNTPAIEGPKGSRGWWNDSPLEYLPKMVRSLRRHPLRLSFYSGTHDPYLGQSLAFAKMLRHYKIHFRFRSYPDDHSWKVWSGELASQMIWLNKDFSC